MMTSPNRLFLLVIVVALAVSSAIVILVLVLLFPVVATAGSGLYAVACLLTPISSFDTVAHLLAVALLGLSSISLVAGACTANRERAIVADLGAMTRVARCRTLPPEVHAASIVTGVNSRLDVVESPRAFGFAYGWLRPRICISTALIHRLSRRELEAVFLHERWHLRQRDPFRLFLLRIIASGFFFLPPMRRLVRDYVVAAEISADRHAVVTMGERRWLAAALAKTMGLPLAVPAFEGHADRRIAALADDLSHQPADGALRRWTLVLAAEGVVLVPLIARGGIPVVAGVLSHPVC
ncbi:MAG: M48 family metalloprotease [Chloroflexota bacterium]|nr:M48 family metalloprotease [Chloroflexota bacterium]